MPRNLFVDMDGVLADFTGMVIKLIGQDWKDENDRVHWHKFTEYSNLFELLKPLPDAFELWNYVHDQHFFHDGTWRFPQILTALPTHGMQYFPDCTTHKRQWIHSYLGDKVKVNFGPFPVDKQYHCSPGDILIDDSQMNIEQWRSRGGIGILHRSAAETIAKLKEL